MTGIVVVYLCVLLCVLADRESKICGKCSCITRKSTETTINCEWRQFTEAILPFVLSNTTNLQLQGNNITTIAKDSFSHLQQLKYLDISNQHSTISIDDYCFKDLHHLETLKISQLHGTPYPLAISRIPGLRHLAITLQPQPVPKEYKKLVSLEELDLSGSLIVNFQETTRHLSVHNVSMLNMSGSSWELYQPGDVSQYAALKILDIHCVKNFGGTNLIKLMADVEKLPVKEFFMEYISETKPLELDHKLIAYINASKIETLNIGTNNVRNYCSLDLRRHLNVISTESYFNFATRSCSHRISSYLSSRSMRLAKLFPKYDLTIFNSNYIFLTASTQLSSNDYCTRVVTQRIKQMENMRQVSMYKPVMSMSQYVEALTIAKNGCAKKWDSNNILKFLNKISIFGNVIRHLYIEKFADSIKLPRLLLGALKKIIPLGQACLCCYAPNLVSLVLKNSKTFAVYPLSEISIVGLQNVQHIVLEDCSLSIVTRAFMSSFPNLAHLSLAKNKLKELISNVFWPLKLLEYLDLSDNQISMLPKGVFSQQSSLKYLILKDNALTKLSLGLKNMKCLKYVDVSVNKLETLEPQTRSFLEKKMVQKSDFFIFMEDNVFQCSCSNIDMLYWMRNMNLKSSVQRWSQVKCHNYENVNLTDYDISKCDSRYSDWIRTLVVTLISVLVPMLVMGVVIYKSDRLRYKWHLLKWRLRFVMGNNRDEHRQNFKIFFSYYSQTGSRDRQWVWEVLKPKLEQDGYSLFIHEIDFHVGECIADNIVYAIDVCDQIVFVLSDNFVSSEWCMFELNMALVKGVHCIVPIRLSPIMKRNRLIKYLTKTRTYLEWKDKYEDIQSADEFWARLYSRLNRKHLDVELPLL